LVQKVGKKGKIKPLFILKAFVAIRGTGYVTNNVKMMQPFLKRSLELNITNELKRRIK
jgi:hypothetical protein